MMNLSLYVSLACSLLAFTEQSHYHNAVASLNLLLKADEQIVEILQQYLNQTMDENIRKIVRSYTRNSKRFTKIVESGCNPFYHPINGFHFLKHAVHSWKDVYAALVTDSTDSYEPVVRAIMSIKNKMEHANSQDILYAAGAISNMQDIYNLSMKHLVRGLVHTGPIGEVFQSIKPLNSWDCDQIGRAALLLDLNERAIEWFNIAKDKVAAGGDSIDIQTLLEHEEKAKTRFETYVSPAEESLKIETYGDYAARADNPLSREYLMRNYERMTQPMAALCRGESVKLKYPKPILSCRYFTRNHAFFKLGPLKMEELSEKPAIMLFHNFMTEQEMENQIEITEKHLISTIVKGKTENTSLPLTCTAKHTYIREENVNGADAKISPRIEAAFGFQIKRRKTQVKNYGIAGAYTPHADFNLGSTDIVGKNDTIANVMTYAGNLTYGGTTVFPLIGVSVPPERGAAVLWYNFFKSGVGDLLTMHGSCPIVYGSKWVITNWIYYSDQMFTHQCGTKLLDRYQLFR